MPELPDGDDDGPSFNDFVRGLQRLSARAAELLEEARPKVDQLTLAFDQRIKRFRDWAAEYGPQIAAGAAALTKRSAESHVENWETLDEDQWVRALSLMCADDGVPLAWGPPAHVVEALVDASDHAARDAALLAHADEIEQDARRLLDLVKHVDLQDLRAATEQGWDAWAAGLDVPAQSTAGVIVGDVLLRYGFKKFGRFREQWETFRDVPVEEWEITELRTTAVMCALSTAVQREDQGHFPGFNRNDALHKLDPEQHSHVNALRGLMLVTAAARELQFGKALEWMTGPGFKTPRTRGTTPEQFAADSEALRRRMDAMQTPRPSRTNGPVGPGDDPATEREPSADVPTVGSVPDDTPEGESAVDDPDDETDAPA